MREAPSDDSRVLSQALFSESVNIEEDRGEWSQIVSSDGYLGWVRSNCLVELEGLYRGDCSVSRVRVHVYTRDDIEYGPLLSLPFGSRLRVLEGLDSRWLRVGLLEGVGYVQKGDVSEEDRRLNKDELGEFSQQFLGLPYTWGGRSSFGYDCSGFVQMLYCKMGVSLPRDARQQVLDVRLRKVGLDALEAGDLVFFGRSEQEIQHVGMLLGGDRFIHTSSRENRPWLRISSLLDFEWSGQGYYSYRTGCQLK